jgi:hypothetical protein
VAPADEAALGTDALGPPSASASKAPGGARERFLEMAANAGGESVALGGLDSEDGIEHACFSGSPHRSMDALQAAMDEDGDALGPPSASASKGRGAGSCCDGNAPPPTTA